MSRNFFICFILLSNVLAAQVNVDWYNYPGGVAVATNNNFDVYTVNWDYNPSGDITLTKRDSSGLILWDSAFDNTDLTRHEVATWVETDYNGDVIVTGTIRSGFSNPVDAASLVMKFDSSGSLLWRVVYESSFEGSSTKKVLVDASNNIYVFGLGMGANGLVTKVKKFDPAGTAVWSYFDTVGIGYPLNIKFTPDSNLLIICRTITGTFNGFSKIDLNGNNIWNKTGIQSATIGDAAGDSSGNTYIINGENVFSNPGSILQKLSLSGSTVWADTNSITAFRVEVGNDDNPVICVFPNSGMPGASFIKYDSNGNIVWLNLDADGPGYALLLHAQMKMDVDNAAYLAAGTLTEMALCKVNSDGSSAWTAVIPGSYANAFDFQTKDVIYVTGGTTAKLGQTIASGSSENVFFGLDENVSIYPNPVSTTATLVFNLTDIKNIEITIIDVTGRVVSNTPMERYLTGTNSIFLSLSDLNSGIYFCSIGTDTVLQRIKFVKE
ncbi:MAG: T9SS type A sorting domain-containing protein [Bacteroidetes bacterium]|nr:T9SS type A sorting domain-containing protein [Bacteroidota bacterium]